MNRFCRLLLLIAALPGLCPAAEFKARVLDADSGQPLAARIYLRNAADEWLFVESAHPEGTALPYREQWVPMPESVERHTTVSAHPFRIELAAGTYQLTVEKGKEYLPLQQTITIGTDDRLIDFRLQRWINMADRGWYSGETHVHRRLHELPNVMLAEDLNVAFPVTFWTTTSDAAPDLQPSTLRRQGPSPFGPREDAGTEPIAVDETHVILPRNTEYEIFSVNGQRHVLGAIFLLNHRTRFTATAPPIGPIAEQAHAEGALLDLDKHSWPWSLMLIPVANVDLFELSNNSVWRTKFGFRSLPADLPDWMTVETDSPATLTEWGWLNYGFQVYYALLNCGFHITPTAGTASGVHPVPLGYSRVYVHTGDAFGPTAWLKRLKQGRSFVTTGPMLFATVNGRRPGESFRFETSEPQMAAVEIESVSAQPVSGIEVLLNGDVVRSLQPQCVATPEGAWKAVITEQIEITETSWLAIRSVEPQPDGRKRFAHTAPWHFSINNTPIVPRQEQVAWFVHQMQQQIERNRNVLSADALAEFEQALQVYDNLARRAR
ncbi:MAG: CehA/McbA family metallohydrolase [Fuerstiella sp.]